MPKAKKAEEKGFIDNLKTTIAGLRGDVPISPPEEVAKWLKKGAVLLDVRTRIEAKRHPVPKSINIPLLLLKGRLSELPEGKSFVTFCLKGGRAEVAKGVLEGNGIKALNGGAYTTILKVLEAK